MGAVDKEVVLKMLQDGKSSREIADCLGVSIQAVSAVSRWNRENAANIEKIPYKGIYEFMMSNPNMTVPKLARLLGLNGDRASTVKLRRFIHGDNVAFTKREYDNLSAVTGMTYEHLFAPRDGTEKVVAEATENPQKGCRVTPLHHRLLQILGERDISTSQFERDTGIARRIFYRQDRKMHRSTIMACAYYFGMSVEELIEGTTGEDFWWG